MSSKSRKKNPPPQAPLPRVTGEPLPVPGSAKTGKPDDEHGLLGEEVIHVPKGRNRLQYALMIALLVFLCVVFLIPEAFQGALLGPDRGDVDYVAYNDPQGGRVELKETAFLRRLNGYEDVFEIGIPEIQFLKIFLGIQSRRLEHEDAARLIVLDDLARASGIILTDAELAEFLGSIEGITADGWRAFTARYGGASKIEPSLKSLLGIRRYLDLLSEVARVPDVDAIEKRWAEEHVELAFDYVQVETADLVEEARSAAPDDDVLAAWFEERPDVEKSALFGPARFRATIAVLRAPEDASGLVERYPDTSGETPEARAESYYNSVFFTRFQRPEPAAEEESGEESGEEPGEESSEDAAPQEPQQPEQLSPYLPLDEVRDVAAREAPGFYAARAWIADLRSRVQAGEEIDFGAEAADLGLERIALDEPATLQELREHEELGAFVVGPISSTQPGQVAPNPVVEPGGLHVVFVEERVDTGLPPFEEIRDEVLDSWARARAEELAVERLATLRDGLEEFEPPVDDETGEVAGAEAGTEGEDEIVHRRADEETFRAAAEASGFEVRRRDWIDKSGPATADPDASKEGHQFLAQHREYGELADGEVPEPAFNRQRTHAFLVRLVGKREMDLARMTPQVYQRYKENSSHAPASEVRAFLTGKGLDENYGISWLVERAVPEDEELEDELGDE